MGERPISVEIFRDSGRSPALTETAAEGVDYIRQLVTGIEIVRTTRLLQMPLIDQHRINVTKVRLPPFEADVNLIVSDRQIVQTDLMVHYGCAYAGKAADRRKYAFIDVKNPDFPHLVVAHEFGHLFHLKERGATWDKSDHCQNQQCIMYPYLGAHLEDVRVPQRGVKALLERQGYRKAEYVATKVPNAGEFCEECMTQFDMNVTLFKHGINF